MPRRLHPVGQGGVVEVVRTRPHIHEGDAPEADDRSPVGIDRPARPLGQVVVHHPEEAGGEEEGDGVVAVPPLRHGILHAGEQRIAFGVSEGHGNGEVVDDVQDRDDQDEGHVVPVGNVDMRFFAAQKSANVDREIDDPDDDQPDVRIPFRLGIFLRLGDAHEIAARGQHAEQIIAEQHEPWTELIRQAGAGCPLQNMK